MGNPDHLKELLKGVAHWNAWREEQVIGFRPDFSGANIREAFEDAGLLDQSKHIPLANADLRAAVFTGANLRGADLRRAVLWGTLFFEADLKGAYLRNADLSVSDLRDANLGSANLEQTDCSNADFSGAFLEGSTLREAVLKEAEFRKTNLRKAKMGRGDLRAVGFREADLEEATFHEADARTIVSPGLKMNDDGGPKELIYRTDFSSAKNLTQDQVNTMLGDSKTIIPQGLERPTHWPVFAPDNENTVIESNDEAVNQAFKDATEDGNGTDAWTGAPLQELSMSRQVTFLLSVPEPAVASATYAADLIEAAVSEAHAKSGQNRSDEGDAFLAIAGQFRTLGTEIAASSQSSQLDQRKISELEQKVADQAAEIDRLAALLAKACEQPSPTTMAIVGAIGGAGATAIVGGTGFLFGPEGAALIQNLGSVFGTPTPPSPGSLPPTTSI